MDYKFDISLGGGKLMTEIHPELAQVEYLYWERPGGYSSVQKCRIEILDELKNMYPNTPERPSDVYFGCRDRDNKRYFHSFSLQGQLPL